MKTQLRDFQTKAIDDLRDRLRHGQRRIVLQAPTGSGKTLIGAAISESVLRNNKRVLFVVPALSLVDQTVEKFGKEGLTDLGVIQSNHVLTNGERPIQIASVQTLMNRELPPADVVLIDEAHEIFKFYGEWMAREEWRKVPFIGLSATPWTKGLGKLYVDGLLVATTTQQLIDRGLLSPFRVFAPSHPDLTGVSMVAGDYHEGELSGAMSKDKLVADIVSTWYAKAEGLPTLCFAVTVAHAELIQAQFRVAGHTCELIDAGTPVNVRNAVSRRFHAGETEVVVSVGCLSRGIDWDVRCIILARPTKSEMLFCQIIGRGLRTAWGKEALTVLDHSDTHLRLGYVTDIHHERLDDGKHGESKAKEREKALPKECIECAFVKPVGLRACPNCGFEPKVQCDIVNAPGELKQVTEATRRIDRQLKQEWFSMLAYIQQERGYKPGWVANQYRKKFEVWPKGLSSETLPPSGQVLSWVTSQNIRYAKRRGTDGLQHAEH